MTYGLATSLSKSREPDFWRRLACSDDVHHLSLLWRLFELCHLDRLRVESSSDFAIHASVFNEDRFRNTCDIDTHHLSDLSMQSGITGRPQLMNLPRRDFQTRENSFWTPREGGLAEGRGAAT